MKKEDKLVECSVCGSTVCYEQVISEDVKTKLCWTCGYTTSSVMKKGSPAVLQAVNTFPELYKDLMFEDKEDFVWFPATITVPEKGMVFVDGTSKEDWKWSAVKAVLLTEEEKKISKNQTHKMDMKNVKHFDRKNFISACEAIGMFE